MSVRNVAVAVTLLLAAASAHAYRISGWIPPWDTAALGSIQRNAVDESNPVWYSMSSRGEIVANWNAENPTWRAAMNGTELLPTIQNVVGGAYDESVVASLLSSAASREAHATAIHALVLAKGYDGIDIDYESLSASQRANFSAFIGVLADKLHASDRLLSVSVYPKVDDRADWDGPAAQDWRILGKHADRVKIMAYDFHWSTSKAGALTPLDWLDRVVTYAESAIPAEKISVALPWYGYDWVGTKGVGVSYSEAMARAKANGSAIRRDASGEATFTYGDHTVYFQDAASYQAKIDLLARRHPNVKRIAHWRVGQEDPAIWSIVAELRTRTSGRKRPVNASRASAAVLRTAPAPGR
jgi:spore germination protein